MAGSLLNRRTFDRAVAAIHTTVTRFRLQALVAIFTYIEILTGISWHGFLFLMPAVRTGNN